MSYELIDIEAGYGPLSVLDRVSLRFEAETVNVVLGPSGCGKSTLLNIVAGLKAPESGRRLGFDSARFSYAFQEARLLPWLSAKENLSFALSGAAPEQNLLAHAEDLLAEAGLAGALDKRPSELSGGMRQRVSLVRAFAYPSDVLLLDEAFQAVDLRTKMELLEVFLRLQRREKRTVVLVTHDIDEAVFLADKIIVLSQRPARVVDEFELSEPRGQRSLGSPDSMRTAARLYRSILG